MKLLLNRIGRFPILANKYVQRTCSFDQTTKVTNGHSNGTVVETEPSLPFYGKQRLKFDLKMKLSALLAVFGFFVLQANSTYSQKKISLDLSDVTVERVLDEIESRTEYRFVYQLEDVQIERKVTISVKKETVDNVLKQVFAQSGTRFTIENGQIYLLSEKKDPAPRAESRGDNPQPQFSVSGTVTDEAGTPLPGVTVIVKGTSRGTSTDFDGNYTIIVPDQNAILVFTSVGYAPKEITVGNQTTINVQLEEAVSELDEVVLNAGYYQTTERAKTGSIAKVTAKEIELQPVTSPLLALQGRVAGLEISPVNGAPGSAPNIRIRGENNLRLDGYPMYIVDGVPIDSSPLTSRSSLLGRGIDPLIAISPSNIESIEILKDADATAIYGSRGANGVILITTKSSGEEEKLSVGLDYYAGFGEITQKLDLLNREEYLEVRREAIQNSGLGIRPIDYDLNGVWDNTRFTDWQEIFLGKKSKISQIQMVLSAGSKNTTFRFGGNYYNETLVFSDDFGYKRLTGFYNMNHMSSDKKFKMSLNISYGNNSSNLFNDNNLFNYLLELPPVAPSLYGEDGELNWQPRPDGTSSWENPLATTRRTSDSRNSSLQIGATISYNIFKNISILTNLGYSETNGEETMKKPISSLDPNSSSFNTATGTSDFLSNKRNSWIVEPQIKYWLSKGKNQLDIVIGSTIQERNTNFRHIQGTEYSSDLLLGSLESAPVINIITDDEGKYRYLALFSRIGYNWNSKYYLNITGRRDGSSRFGPGKQFGNFGAIGLAWIFSNESFLKDSSFLSFGKIRGSYGLTGNDQIGDYQFYDSYEATRYAFQGASALTPTRIFNPVFAWGKTTKLEVALDLGFIKDRINIGFNWYNNQSSNQLVQYQLPSTTGFSSVLSNFDATVENSGNEFVLNTRNIWTESFKWTTSANLAINRNKLVDFEDIEDSPYATTYKVGEPLNVGRYYTYLGVDSQTGLHTALDINEDGIINDEDKEFKNLIGNRKYGGITNTFNFKNFEFSFLFQFVFQNRPKELFRSPPGYTRANQSTDILDRWQHPGDISDTQMFSSNFEAYSFFSYYSSGDTRIVDASFARLKSLSINYTIPNRYIEKFGLSKLNFFLQGQNLLTISKYEALDPETGNAFPPLRTVTTGVQIQF